MRLIREQFERDTEAEAEVTSARTLNASGELGTPDVRDWYQRWKEFSRRNGDRLRATLSFRHTDRWHRTQAEVALARQGWFTAAWHLDRLAVGPRDVFYCLRRADIAAGLGDHQKAAEIYTAALGDPFCPIDSCQRLVDERAAGHQWAALAADLGRVVEANPGVLRYHFQLARALACLGQWKQAASEYRRVLDDNPFDWVASHNHGSILLLLGKQAEYQALCRGLKEHLGESQDAATAVHVARTCCLGPDPGLDRDWLIRVARRATTREPRVPWYQYSLGLAYFRAGQYPRAAACFKESLQLGRWDAFPLDWLLLSMTCYKLGQVAEAERWRKQLDKEMELRGKKVARFPIGENPFAPSDLNDWLDYQVLRSELEKMRLP